MGIEQERQDACRNGGMVILRCCRVLLNLGGLSYQQKLLVLDIAREGNRILESWREGDGEEE